MGRIDVIGDGEALDPQDELDDWLDTQEALAILAEWRRAPSTAEPWEKVKAELLAEGQPDQSDDTAYPSRDEEK